MTAVVIGRDTEIASVEVFVDGAAVGPAALVLSGEAGIGKTAVWSAGVERARDRGLRVLSCRCVESEAPLSFAGLSDLLAPVFDRALPTLAPPRRHALEVALLLAAAGAEPLDERAVGLAVLDILRVVAKWGPVLLAVDDAQWLDIPSARALRMALRRLRDEQVRLLATVRVDTGWAPPELEPLFAAGSAAHLPLSPLSLGGLHHLLKRRLALELSRRELVHLEMVTGGNPFYALELGREVVRTGTRPSGPETWRVPENLRELLGARLSRLPRETDGVLLLAAALVRPTAEQVAAAFGEQRRAFAALDVALREEAIELDGSRIRFAHPLLASICYQRAPIWRRREAHAALAAVVTNVEERARHRALAAAGPDADIALEVEAAAEQAAQRGATAVAAELSELAAQLTPDDPESTRRRRLRAAHLHRLAGAGERSAVILDELLDETPAGAELADVLFELASTFHRNPPRVIELCGNALLHAGGDDARSARILAWRAWARSVVGVDVSSALADARAALELAERVGDQALIASAIAQVGGIETWAGAITARLLERGVEIERRLQGPFELPESPRFALARRLWRLDDADGARELLTEMEEIASARGDELSRWFAVGEMITLEWFNGRWARALELAEPIDELVEQTEGPTYRVWVGRFKSLLETDLGLAESARATAEEALAVAETTSSEFLVGLCHGALGHLEFALGNLEFADRYFRSLAADVRSGGVSDPMNPVWSDAIETMIALGRLDEARAHLDRQEELARRLGGRWPLAAVARGRGLLAAANADTPTAVATFRDALQVLEPTSYALERGRTLLGLGSALRQARQKGAARDVLTESLVEFVALGARLWAEKARAELRRISGRRRGGDKLTETERLVASLAAEGLSNKEIAAAAFMSVHTVAAHLTHTYRKLGIHSRAALAHRLTQLKV